MKTEEKLDALCAAFEDAKANEASAREARIAIEEQISALVGQLDEGTVSAKGLTYKVRVAYRINRNVDEKVWANEVAPKLPPAIAHNLMRTKLSLDMKGFRWLEENRPDLLTLVSKAITAKPAKPTIEVKEQ